MSTKRIDLVNTVNNLQQAQLCPECGKLELRPAIISRECCAKHDGTLRTFVVPKLHVLKCDSCGEILFDSATNEQISQGLRDHLGLLSPQEIREKLRFLGLNQRTFAERLQIAEETISRWLSGAYIQSRGYDKYMRLFFSTEESKCRIETSAGGPMAIGEFLPSANMAYQCYPTNQAICWLFPRDHGGPALAA